MAATARTGTGVGMEDREVVGAAFQSWMDGTGYISSLFAPEMTWEIVGRSAASRSYPDAAAFVSQVLEPFGRRFRRDAPFRPTRIRGLFSDRDTVIVLWDGSGTTIAGTEYANTYAWFLHMRDGLIVDGIAFYDSYSFDELWNGVAPA